MLTLPDDLEPYCSGSRLYGEDLSNVEIARWLRDESEAYADLGYDESLSGHRYPYHAANRIDFWARLFPEMTGCRVLGFGSAHGAEFLPVLDKWGELVIAEPDQRFHTNNSIGARARYVLPSPADGSLPIGGDQFDLVTWLGELHHLPKVSDTLKELSRVLAQSGRLVLREPCVSMGDWRATLPGLTTHERGIPTGLLKRMLEDSGLQPQYFVRINVGLVSKLSKLAFRSLSSEGPTMTKFDRAIGRLPIWSNSYRREALLAKLGPNSVSIIARKV